MTSNYITCPTCGTQQATGPRFCGSCGSELPGTPESQTALGSQPSYPQQPYKPINPTSYDPHTNAEQPSYIPTVLITLFLGIFGLIPAVRHSQMAKSRGYSQNGYWWIFGGILGGQAVLGILFAVILPLAFVTSVTSSINNLSNNSGNSLKGSPISTNTFAGLRTGFVLTCSPLSNLNLSSNQFRFLGSLLAHRLAFEENLEFQIAQNGNELEIKLSKFNANLADHIVSSYRMSVRPVLSLTPLQQSSFKKGYIRPLNDPQANVILPESLPTSDSSPQFASSYFKLGPEITGGIMGKFTVSENRDINLHIFRSLLPNFAQANSPTGNFAIVEDNEIVNMVDIHNLSNAIIVNIVSSEQLASIQADDMNLGPLPENLMLMSVQSLSSRWAGPNLYKGSKPSYKIQDFVWMQLNSNLDSSKINELQDYALQSGCQDVEIDFDGSRTYNLFCYSSQVPTTAITLYISQHFNVALSEISLSDYSILQGT